MSKVSRCWKKSFKNLAATIYKTYSVELTDFSFFNLKTLNTESEAVPKQSD